MLKSSIVNLILKSFPIESLNTDLVKLEQQKQRLLESDFLDFLIRIFKSRTTAFSILLDGPHDDISYAKYIEFLQDNFIYLPIYPRLQPFFMQIMENETRDLTAEQEIKSAFRYELTKKWEPKAPTILDHRVHNELSAAERFFTYFATLLKMPKMLSNCTAICLSTALSGDELQLYISCNLSRACPHFKVIN